MTDNEFIPNPNYVPYTSEVRDALQALTGALIRSGISAYYFELLQQSIQELNDQAQQAEGTALKFAAQALNLVASSRAKLLRGEAGLAFGWNRNDNPPIITTASKGTAAAAQTLHDALTNAQGKDYFDLVFMTQYYPETGRGYLDSRIDIGHCRQAGQLVLSGEVPDELQRPFVELFDAQRHIGWWAN